MNFEVHDRTKEGKIIEFVQCIEVPPTQYIRRVHGSFSPCCMVTCYNTGGTRKRLGTGERTLYYVLASFVTRRSFNLLRV